MVRIERRGAMPTLKEARAVRLLTIRKLAERAGVAASTVYLAENGRSAPRFEVIEKLSAALGVEPAEIVEFAAAIEGIASGKAAAAAGLATTAAG
jgi:transcriptional regulator with XRE-family HTH domain